MDTKNYIAAIEEAYYLDLFSPESVELIIIVIKGRLPSCHVFAEGAQGTFTMEAYEAAWQGFASCAGFDTIEEYFNSQCPDSFECSEILETAIFGEVIYG